MPEDAPPTPWHQHKDGSFAKTCCRNGKLGVVDTVEVLQAYGGQALQMLASIRTDHIGTAADSPGYENSTVVASHFCQRQRAQPAPVCVSAQDKPFNLHALHACCWSTRALTMQCDCVAAWSCRVP